MSPLFEELRRNPLFAGYLLVGVLVALVHMRQHRMIQRTEQVQVGMMLAVTLMLALMWPILLLAMLLNLVQARGHFVALRKRVAKKARQSGSSDIESLN